VTEEDSEVGTLLLDAASEMDDEEGMATDGNAASNVVRSNVRSGFTVLSGSLPSTGMAV